MNADRADNRRGIGVTAFALAAFLLVCLGISPTGHALDSAEADRLNEEFRGLFAQGRFREAIPLGEKVLALRVKILGPEDEKTLGVMNNVAATYHHLGDYWKAEPLLKKVAAIRERVTPDHRDTVISIINLAALYRTLGDFGKAEPLYRKALATGERVHGTDHPELSIILRGLSLLYMDTEEFGKAEDFAKRSLIMNERFLGPDHVDTGIALSNLAVVYDQFGEYGKAEAMFKRSFAVAEKALGPNHPETAAKLNNLAALYGRLGEDELAEVHYRRALAIMETSLGPEHPSTAIVQHNFAKLYQQGGKYAQAEGLLERAREIHRKAFGPDHGNVRIIQITLGSLYLESGDLPKAYKIFADLRHPTGLGGYYLAKGEAAKAEAEFRRALAFDVDRGQPHLLVSDHLGLALALEAQGKHALSEAQYRRSIEWIESLWKTLSADRKKNFLSGDTGIGFRRIDAYEGLIRVLLKQGRDRRAGEAFEVAERVKGRRFLELLASRDLKGRVGKDEKVLEEERNIKKEIVALMRQVQTLEEAGGTAEAPELINKRKELKASEDRYDRFIEEVKLQGAELADLVSVVPPSLGEVKSHLDAETTLVEYYTARDFLYIWVITRTDIRVHQISLGEETVRLKVDDLVLRVLSEQERSNRPRLLRLPSSEIRGLAVKAKNGAPDRYLEASQALYNNFLRPVIGNIRTRRLAIVPTGRFTRCLSRCFMMGRSTSWNDTSGPPFPPPVS